MKNYLDRYLAGDAPLHPERLAVPTDEELEAAEAAFDRLMAGREPSTITEDKPHRRVSLWRWAAAEDKPHRRVVSLWRWAAAASLLLIIGIGTTIWMDKLMQEEQVAANETVKPSSLNNRGYAQRTPGDRMITEGGTLEEHLTGGQSPCEVAKDQSQQPKPKTLAKSKAARKEIPDTLGNGIWQSERNVQIALQMLGECEAVIEKSEQEMRNTIVKATFNATPQPANAVLVTNEAGDCEVIETKTIIEI